MATLADFEVRTMPGFWNWYDSSARQQRFQAQSRSEAEAWQKSLRETITRLLGGKPDMSGYLDPHVIESVKEEGYTREKIVIQVQPGEYMPCYVLIPDAVSGPHKPVIALHGHGTWGANGIVGLTESNPELEFIRMHNYDYARQFALRGFMVFAPVLRAFGDRMETARMEGDTDEKPEMWMSSCKPLGMNLLLRGQTLLGWRVWDVMRLIDYIRSRPEKMSDTLGCVGLSGGGMITLWTTALDTRISAAVVSGYFNSFKESIMSIDHCVCNYVPGIVQYAEMSDIAGLVAPRPLLVESADKDTIFPMEATKRALSELRPIYQCFGAADRIDADFFEGAHQWSGKKAYDWLKRWL